MNKHRAQTCQEKEWHFAIIFQSSCYGRSSNMSAAINFHKIIHIFSILLPCCLLAFAFYRTLIIG